MDEIRNGTKNRVGDPLLEIERKEAQELVEDYKAAHRPGVQKSAAAGVVLK